MNDQLLSILPSVVILGVAAFVAAHLAVARNWANVNDAALHTGSRVALAAIFFQAVHFSEELMTGFYERFPALFGLPPMSIAFFVSFNIIWLVIWSISAKGVIRRNRVAVFALWFLGIGSAMNGIAHPALSMYVGGYFPGLVTSPFVGVMGFFLLRRLLGVTLAGSIPHSSESDE